MRTIRALTTVVALVLALPCVTVAQQGRQFNDAWFWGVKGGLTTFGNRDRDLRVAPTIGAEWMITRKHGGLYVSASDGITQQFTFLPAGPDSPDTTRRLIAMTNLLRVDAAMIGFPGTHIVNHPYVGVGISMSIIPGTEGAGPFATQADLDFTQQAILDRKVSLTPIFLAGLQHRMQTMSVFGQASISQLHKDFLLWNGHSWSFSAEIGVRYNVGTSISKD